jgi:hypothetical protein
LDEIPHKGIWKMKQTSYTVNLNSHKKHKFLRGLRCFASSFVFNKHSSKPGVNSRGRIGAIINTLSPFGQNVAVLSFFKSRHNTIVYCDKLGYFGFVSAYSDRVYYSFYLHKDTVIEELLEEAVNWQDDLHDSSVAYISSMNTNKMKCHIEMNAPINRFNILTNNCSRFAANVLLAGCNASKERFNHNRPWQMPANTLELAREINAFLKNKSSKYF